MKKALSIVLVLTMLMGIVAVGTVGTAATAYVAPYQLATTTQYGNQQVSAAYFGGQLDFTPLNCKASLTPAQKDSRGYTEGTSTVRDGDDSLGVINIDGKIDAGEWGAPVLHIDSDYAANNIGIIGYSTVEKNDLFTAPSAENTYFYNREDRAPLAGLAFDLYLMWDEDYFYVAVTCNDPDGPKQVNNAEGIWDGDTFQMKLDTLGPNSEFDGGQFVGGEESYTNAATGATDKCHLVPWKGENFSRTQGLEKGEEYKETMNNFLFSYISADGGRTAAYDGSNRYNPTHLEYDYENAAGESVHYSGTAYSGAEIDDWSQEIDEEDFCYAVVRWDNLGTASERNDVATYEIALPWSLIQRGFDGSTLAEYVPEAGNILGMSAVLFNAGVLNTPAGPATDNYNSFLAWGGGICNHQTNTDFQTNAGSNAVLLSDTPYSVVAGCNHQFEEATCIAPSTCTLCGYQRGYASGHDNEITALTLPSATRDGFITTVCNFCHEEVTSVLPAEASAVYRSYTTETETSIAGTPGYSGSWAGNWTDGNPDDPRGVFDAEGHSLTAEETTTFGYKVLDYATNGSGRAYDANGDLATIYGTGNPCGTYFQTSLEGDCLTSKKVAMSTEYYFDNLNFNSPDYHSAGVYYQFGGPTGVKFDAGLFYNENICFFAIGEDAVLTNNPANDAFKGEQNYLNKLHAYVLIDKEDIDLEAWHRMTFIYDSDEGMAMLFWDDELILLAQDPHFATSMRNLEYMIQRRFQTNCYVKNLYATSLSWAAANFGLKGPGQATSYNLTIDGVTTQVTAGEEITLNAAAFENGYRFAEWEGDTSVLTLNVNNATFTMPEADVTLTSKYVLVGDANTDGKINAQDANFLSQIIVGSVGSVIPADINNDGKVNATDSNMLTKMITGTYSPIA